MKNWIGLGLVVGFIVLIAAAVSNKMASNPTIDPAENCRTERSVDVMLKDTGIDFKRSYTDC